ncbi:MAG: pectinesterase family protein [Terriglobia bacterium]
MTCRVTSLFALAILLAPSWTAARDLLVAADGSGDFQTVQAAVDSVPDDSRERTVLFIKNGTYQEQVRIHKPFLTFRGEDRKKTRIVSEVDTSACPIQPGQSKEEQCSVIIADASDLMFENFTVLNSFQGRGKGAALSVIGGARRTVIANVDVVGYGGDTLVLTSRGEYYLNDVYVSGTYHIIVPRGTTYAVNSTFWCLGDPHCLFNEGILHESDKMVIRHSVIDGPAPFGLGSYFRDAAWYFIENTISDKLTPDGQIVREPARNYEMKWGEGRIYFADNKAPNYAWLGDNLETSPAKVKTAVTAAWTFPEWDPESKTHAVITRIETGSDQVRLVFNESVTVHGHPRIKLASGRSAVYVSGSGTDTLVFKAPCPCLPVVVQLNGAAIFASAASLHSRDADLSLVQSKRAK